jgi:sporadic carbohydrate cluster protein (TIGR04323 family)
MKNLKGYRGYCTHNAFGEYRMPIPAQNIIYRDYANKNELHFKLSVNELFFPECFLNLYSLLDELDQLKGVLMCSIFMLPKQVVERQKIYQRFLESECELHFVLESLVIRIAPDVETLEDLFRLREELSVCPTIEQLKKWVL